MRTIVTQKDVQSIHAAAVDIGGGPPVPTKDDYFTRLLKYIPSEILGLFLFGDGLIRGQLQNGGQSSASANPHQILEWTLFVVCAILTPVYLRFVQKVTKPLQLAISSAAFFVWVFAMGGPFTRPGTSWYEPLYGSLALAVFAVAAKIVEP